MEKLIKQIATLKAELKALDAQQAAIEKAAEDENGGVLSDEQRKQYQAIGAEYDQKKAALETAEAELKARQSRANRPELSQPAPRATAPNSGSPLHREDSGETATEFRLPARARREHVQNFSGTVDNRSPQERAYRMGMWALNRLQVSLPGQFHFPNAAAFVRDYMGAAHGSNDGQGSQYLIPEEFSSDLIVLREEYGVARRLFRRWTMTTDTLHIPRQTGDMTVYFVAEGAAGTEAQVSTDEVLLVARDLMALARFSRQLSDDSAINFGDYLLGAIARAFANKEDDCGFNGDGTSTYGGIRGARNVLQDVDLAGTDSQGLVTGTGNLYSELTLQDFHDVTAQLPLYARSGAVWVASATFYDTVMASLQTAAGGNTVADIANGGQQRFLGYPVVLSQVMPTAEANSQVCALLGNFGQGAALGDRQMESIAFSESAVIGGASTFERNQIAVRATERFDIKVHDCGSSSTAGPICGLQTAAS